MRRIGLELLLPAVLALAGCMSFNSGDNARNNPPPEPPSETETLPLVVTPATQPAPGGLDPAVSQPGFQVYCDVTIVDAPAGSLSKAKELWSRVREDLLGVKLGDHLARNGLRVGIGQASDSEAVADFMTRVRDGRTRTGRLRFESESAMEVILDPQVRARRPFVYAADGSVSGDEYPAGVSIYWVQAWHDVERLDSVNLTLVPEIRYGRTKERFYSPGMPRPEQYRDVGRLFNEVRFQARLSRGEFLLLAPRATEGPALVLGRSLLCDETNKAQPRELVMLVRPRVVRTPG